MMHDPADDPAEEIPVGRRMVRARNETGLSLTERLAAQFYRLTWRTPLHALRLRGRYPLKLLAVPSNPIQGDAARGQAILDGAFLWRGEKLVVAEASFAETTLSESFNEWLQSFAWLRDLAAAAPRETAAPVAEALTARWLATHGDKVTVPAWRPDLWGWRILYWAAHAPLILSSADLVYRSSVLNTLARGARHLDQSADRAPQGLPRIAAWTGIVAAGLLIAGGDPRRSFGEAGLAKALASGVGGDGGIVCRTPSGQLALVELLSLLLNVYDARGVAAPAVLLATIGRAVRALLGVTLGDGGLSSWQGSRAAPPAEVAKVVEASGERARPLRLARDWGYQRLQAGNTIVITDAAPPPIARVSGGGCASTLAFELSDGPHRLVVNCGGANLGGAYLTAGLAEGLRTTAAHSTLTLADNNSTALLNDGVLGKGVSEVTIDRQELEGSSRIEASHDGYARRFGLIHQRVLALSGDGRELKGEDVLLPSSGRRKPVTAAFAVRFHLAPGTEATPTADGLGALLRIDGGPLWQFRSRGAKLDIDDSVWIDPEGRPIATQQLVMAAEAPPGGASVSWLFKRAG
jgi:uncharacterized heparinase superfamily protein